MRRLVDRVRGETVLVVVVFWALQFAGWILMMPVVFTDPQPFTSSLLFTVLISVWALVEAAGTAFLSAWALLQAKHNTAKLDVVHEQAQAATSHAATAAEHAEQAAVATQLDVEALERGVMELAGLPPGSEARRLAEELKGQLHPR